MDRGIIMPFMNRIAGAVALGAALLLGLPSAQALYIATITEVGPNVVVNGSGSIDFFLPD
jgi:hypothetical protein